MSDVDHQTTISAASPAVAPPHGAGGGDEDASRSPASTAEVRDPKFDVRFDGLRNALYHSARAAYYDKLNRWGNFLIVVFGMGSAVEVLSGTFGISSISKYLGFAAGFIGVIQLVFDFSGKSKTHDYLKKRFFEILSEVELCDDSEYKKLNAKMSNLYSEEPLPTMRAVDAIAYNQAVLRLKRDPEQHILKVPRSRFIFQNICVFPNDEFRK